MSILMCQIESRDIGDVSRYPVCIQTPSRHWDLARWKLDHQIQEFHSRISRFSRISRIFEKYIWNHDLCHVIVWNEQTETHAMFSRAGANISGFLDHIFFQDFQEFQEFQESWNSWNSWKSWNSWTQNLHFWFMKFENRQNNHYLSYSRDNRPFRQHISLDLKFSCWFL